MCLINTVSAISSCVGGKWNSTIFFHYHRLCPICIDAIAQKTGPCRSIPGPQSCNDSRRIYDLRKWTLQWQMGSLLCGVQCGHCSRNFAKGIWKCGIVDCSPRGRGFKLPVRTTTSLATVQVTYSARFVCFLDVAKSSYRKSEVSLKIKNTFAPFTKQRKSGARFKSFDLIKVN